MDIMLNRGTGKPALPLFSEKYFKRNLRQTLVDTTGALTQQLVMTTERAQHK